MRWMGLPAELISRRVIGLDTSSKCIGWALFEGTRLLKFGKFQLEGADHGQKLLQAYSELYDLFKASKADSVYVEMPYRSSAYGILMWYIGVVLLAHYAVYTREIPKGNKLQSRAIKTAMGVEAGKNHDHNKQIMVSKVNEQFGLSLKFKAGDKAKLLSGDDIADAIAAGWTGVQKEILDHEQRRRLHTKSNRPRTSTRKAKTRRS